MAQNARQISAAVLDMTCKIYRFLYPQISAEGKTVSNAFRTSRFLQKQGTSSGASSDHFVGVPKCAIVRRKIIQQEVEGDSDYAKMSSNSKPEK